MLQEQEGQDDLDRLIQAIFEICETHGSDYQAERLRELLRDYVSKPSG